MGENSESTNYYFKSFQTRKCPELGNVTIGSVWFLSYWYVDKGYKTTPVFDLLMSANASAFKVGVFVETVTYNEHFVNKFGIYWMEKDEKRKQLLLQSIIIDTNSSFNFTLTVMDNNSHFTCFQDTLTPTSTLFVENDVDFGCNILKFTSPGQYIVFIEAKNYNVSKALVERKLATGSNLLLRDEFIQPPNATFVMFDDCYERSTSVWMKLGVVGLVLGMVATFVSTYCIMKKSEGTFA